MAVREHDDRPQSGLTSSFMPAVRLSLSDFRDRDLRRKYLSSSTSNRSGKDAKEERRKGKICLLCATPERGFALTVASQMSFRANQESVPANAQCTMHNPPLSQRAARAYCMYNTLDEHQLQWQLLPKRSVSPGHEHAAGRRAGREKDISRVSCVTEPLSVQPPSPKTVV